MISSVYWSLKNYNDTYRTEHLFSNTGTELDHHPQLSKRDQT